MADVVFDAGRSPTKIFIHVTSAVYFPSDTLQKTQEKQTLTRILSHNCYVLHRLMCNNTTGDEEQKHPTDRACYKKIWVNNPTKSKESCNDLLLFMGLLGFC